MKKINGANGLALDEIELSLDSYDDIFSDFDPRPYNSRALSNDFLIETKKASADKFSDEISLRLIVPKRLRNIIHESLIEKRLKEHFTKHFRRHKKDLRRIKTSGLTFILFGAILMFFSYLIYSELLPFSAIVQNIFLVIAEPGGWFLFWIGGEKFVYGMRDAHPEYEFYRKMASSKITFNSAEAEGIQDAAEPTAAQSVS